MKLCASVNVELPCVCVAAAPRGVPITLEDTLGISKRYSLHVCTHVCECVHVCLCMKV